ncbi:MAG TPA: AMP-binding protein, partial [Candidatus Dormibacteraeota bacterium]|nr:AMP-binding protein [Candidatus Dormibacteraeota bacterium]
HNLARLGEEALERLGDRASLFFEGRWYRSGEMFERSRRIAGALAARGLQPGDRAVVMMSNSPDVGVIYNALWRAGAAITPAIFLLADQELGNILRDSGARAVFTSAEFLPRVRAAAAAAPDVEWIICPGGEDGTISLDELAAAEPLSLIPRADSDLAALMYTGGTTGRAKGVMLSHENLWRAGGASHEAGYVPGVNRSLVSLPLSHSFGLLVTVVGMHSIEPGVGVLMKWFDPAGCLTLIQEHGVQVVPLVPSMIQVMLAQPLEDYDLSSLRFFACGAAPLAADVIHELERRVPNCEVREGYGLTESSAIISSTRPGRRRLGSVGEPVPGCEVRILNNDDRDVAVGELGEICARSGTIMQGYWKAPELTAATVRDGWLHTGDIGHLDADGFLYIVDRIKDLIIRNGFNVYPRDVEDALLEHPAVQLAAVVGRPDPATGEEVVAFVSLNPGAEVTPAELVEYARQKLGAYKYPREVRIMDAVPLTPVGKVDRKAIRARLKAAPTRQS